MVKGEGNNNHHELDIPVVNEDLQINSNAEFTRANTRNVARCRLLWGCFIF